MKYLLDTNIVIAIRNKNPKVLAELQKHRIEDIAISSIVYFELIFGAYNSQRVQDNLADLHRLPFTILPFGEKDAYEAGLIRSDLKTKGTPIGAYDTLIAGQAISQGLILITHNIKEFNRVANLAYENWL
ncbi:tRNA(fMet)-specific endonuclease VapC [Moraxella lacunata]|uniref:tRNA(fMet)-specific endonuclease VapC n=1 Tax=Moraxella lacunata TaxID=477 RepID=A0A378TQV2_MORLA|nr:type II toxin-antitoxin system VapC family toxin [Moraxella lacunata]STZ63188.1 tRNA(fMet)-specific endonuclease VapC [Moraxella lacunata]